MATIREVLESKGREIVAVDGNVPLSQAVSMMVSRNIGALVIQGDRHPEGIITERDVLRNWNEKEKVQDAAVKDLMTRKLIVVNIDDTMIDALTVMIRKNIRHLIVMEGAKVVGFLSIRDLVKEQIKNNEAKISLLEDVLSSELSKEL